MNQNKKALIILAVVLLIFGGFLTFILSSSPISSAVKKIRDCTSIAEIKTVYQSIENPQVKSNEALVKEVRDKINSFQPNETQLHDCVEWLPARPVSINVVIVPDLSNRLDGRFADQNKIDKELLNGIWESFKSIAGPKKKSKDRLAIDVTDNGQIDGRFRNIADKSIITLSANDPKLVNEFYFDKLGNSIPQLIDSLYELTKENPISGANYWKYFDQYLLGHFQKSTIYDEIQNKVIILTDGYLELSVDENLTPIFKDPKENPIKACKPNYSSWSILICEVRERESDRGRNPYQILKTYWHDWLKSMNFQNLENEFFIPSNPATKSTIEKIREFIGASAPIERKSSENIEPSVASRPTDRNQECLTDINALISGKQNISAENIDELVNASLEKCKVDKIVIDDGILRRNLKRFLLSKSKEVYIGTETSIENKILTVKAQKQ